MKKVKMIFPDGSIKEVDESDVAIAESLGAKAHSEADAKSTSMVFPDGTIKKIDPNDLETALTLGAIKKKDGSNGVAAEPNITSTESVPATSQSQLPINTNVVSAFDLPFNKTPIVLTSDGTQFPVNEVVTKDYVSLANTPEAIQALQERLSTKNVTQQDVEALAKSSGKSVNATSAYIHKGKDAGSALDVTDNVTQKKQEIVTGFNALKNSLGVIGTQFNADEILSSADKSALFLQQINNLQEDDAKRKSKVQVPSAMSFAPPSATEPFVPKIDPTLTDQVNNTKDALYYNIKKLTAEEADKNGLSSEQAGELLYKRLDPTGYVKNQAMRNAKPVGVFDRSFTSVLKNVVPIAGAVDAINTFSDWVTGKDKLDKETLNAERSQYELDANAGLKYLAIEKKAQAIINQDQSLLDEAETISGKIQDDNAIIEKSPMLIKQQMADYINKRFAQETGVLEGTEPEGLNGRLLSTAGINNDVAKRYLKEGGFYDKPNYKDFADEVANNQNTYLADNSTFGGVGLSFLKPFRSIFNTVADLTGARSESDRRLENVRDEMFPKTLTEGVKQDIEFKALGHDFNMNVANTINSVANLGGYIAVTAATAGVGSEIGLSATTAQRMGAWASFGMDAIDSGLKEADKMGLTPSQSWLYAGMKGAMMAEGGRLLEFGKVAVPTIKGVNENLAKAAIGISNKTLAEDGAKELLNGAGNAWVKGLAKYGIGTAKGAGVMTGFSVGDNLLKVGFGDKNINPDDILPEAANAYFNGLFTMGIIGSMGIKGNIESAKNSTYKGMLSKIIDNQDASKDVLRIGLERGIYTEDQYNEKLQILNTGIKAKTTLNDVVAKEGINLTPEQKSVWVANTTVEKILRNEAAKDGITEDKSKEYIQQAANLVEQNTKILNGLTFNSLLEPQTDLHNADLELKKAQADFAENPTPENEQIVLDKKAEFEKVEIGKSKVAETTDESGIVVEPPQFIPEPILVGDSENIVVDKPKSFPEPTTVGGETKPTDNLKEGDKIQWDLFGNEENSEWTVGKTTTTKGGQPAVELSREVKKNEGGFKAYTETHIVPFEDLKKSETKPETVSEPSTLKSEALKDVIKDSTGEITFYNGGGNLESKTGIYFTPNKELANSFSEGKGAFREELHGKFDESKKSKKVTEAKLVSKNPKKILYEGKEITPQEIEQYKADGFDSIISYANGEIREVVVFDKSQIKESETKPTVKSEEVSYPLEDADKWTSMGDEKNKGQLVNMTPDEFLSKAKELEMNESDRKKIDKLKQHILDGNKLDPLKVYSNIKNILGSNIDGRHRAMAAKELGIKEVPVLDYTIENQKSETKPIQNEEAKVTSDTKQAAETSKTGEGTTEISPKAEKTTGKEQKHSGKDIKLPPVSEEGGVAETSGEEVIGITHAEIAKTRKELGLPEYGGKATETHEQLLETAQELIKGGYNLNKIFDKVKNSEPTSNVENAIMAEYKAALDVEMAKNPTKETLKKLTEFATISDEAGTALGKGLESRKILKKLSEADTLANFLVLRQKDKGYSLNDAQIKEQTEKFNELTKAKNDLEAALKIEQEKNAKLIAEQGLNKAKATRRKEAKKTHEEYVQERKDAVSAAREALKKLRTGEAGLSVRVPLVNELIAIAPHVKKAVESLLNEGVDKLDNIVNAIHADFKDVLDGISKKDIMDIIGGVHDEKRQTANEKNADLRLLKREAELLNTLQRERLGEEKAKSETQKGEKTRRIEELENKIKEVRKQKKERGIEDDSPRENTASGEENKAMQGRLTKRIEKLQDDLKNKRYAPEPKKQDNLVYTRKTQLLKDKVIELENKITQERYNDERAKMSKWEKIWDKFQNIAGIRRVVQTAIDASIWFRQLGSLALNPRKWDIAKKFIVAGSRSVFSQTNYDRYMDAIHKSEDFKESLDDGIRYNELGAADPKNQNEFFPRSFVYKIPVIKQILTASQRIADSSLNVARYELYNKYKSRLIKRGITRESDPEMYKAMAKVVMNSTGSGNLLSALENRKAEKVMGALFYGARLMAANFNTLNPMYYVKLPKPVRAEAMKDLASYTSTVLATTLALAAAGGKVSLNPDESGFLQIRFGDKVYDLTGGKAAYIRTFLRLVEAGYARATKTKYEANKSGKFAYESGVSFFRNKLSPNTGYAINAFTGKNSIGQPFDPYEAVKIYPMYADDAYKAAKEDGYISLLTVLMPNILGVGYGNYFSEPAMKPIEETLERNMRSDEINKETIKNYNNEGAAITDKEFQTYIEKRDDAIEQGIKDLYEGTAPENQVLDENNEVVTKKYDKLTKEQIIEATSSIKRRATNEVKEELFGKRKETKADKKAKQKLSKARKEAAE